MDPQQYPSVRWFVIFEKLAAWSGVVIAAFGGIGAGVAAVESGIGTGLGVLAAAFFFAALAAFHFWIVRVTTDGRPIGVQVMMALCGLWALVYLSELSTDPAHASLHVASLIGQGFVFWWYYRAMSHLTGPKPPTGPTNGTWVLDDARVVDNSSFRQ